MIIRHAEGLRFYQLTRDIKEHIVQWHPTILSKLALIPQNRINSYGKSDRGAEYKTGDMVVRFEGCSKVDTKSCEAEAQRFAPQWRSSFKNS